MQKVFYLIQIFLLTFLISCIDASVDKKTFKNYLFLINSDSLEYNPFAGTTVKTRYFVWNSIEYSGWLEFCIMDLKNASDIPLDSITLDDNFNYDIGFSRFSNTTSINNGHYLSYRNNYDFGGMIRMEFSDISDIDTVFKSANCMGFVCKPTKFALSDSDHHQQVIFDDEIRNNRILNLFYKSDSALYFIQIKSGNLNAKGKIDYSFIKYLKLT